MKQGRDFITDALHIFVLGSFAIAQPLFDLLGRNAEFFVVRRSQPVDVILLILTLCVLFPALAVLAEAVTGLLDRRVRKAVHGIAVACLAAAITLQGLKQMGDTPGTYLVAGAALLGVALAVTYLRFPSLQFYLTVLSPAVLIFPGLFLFHSPVFKVVFPKDNPLVPAAKVNATAPIVMVIFDEFPLTSLMDEHRQIDPIRYPNFAALAEDATWFRNTTTVADFTTEALPAILTGMYPDRRRLPTAADHPRNIFTLLGSSYRLSVSETLTQLCPEQLCETQKEILAKRMYALLEDLSIVYVHLLLPNDLRAALPPVGQTWMKFAGNATKLEDNAENKLPADDWDQRWRENWRIDRLEKFSEFVHGIDSTDEPTLYFLHTLFPHYPYEYMPSGKAYRIDNRVYGLGTNAWDKWDDDEWTVLQAEQGYLLQVGFVDTLLGRLLDRLKAVGLYERSLIVVTADHGVSFHASDQRRKLTKTNFRDIIPVPLLVKAPHQRESFVDDRNVETIDILPTVAQILGIELPYSVDGHSALEPSLPDREQKAVYLKYPQGDEEKVFFPSSFAAEDAALRRKLALFSSGADFGRLFAIGPNGKLVGRRVVDVGVSGEASAKIGLYLPVVYAHVDPKADFVPAHITGYMQLGWDARAPLDLAIAVNGTIRATSRTYTFPVGGKTGAWSAVVSEGSFRAGENDIEVFVISSTPGRTILQRAYKRTQQVKPPYPRNFAIAAAKWIWEVEETGFHGQEHQGEKPFRWTNGTAKLIVPIDENNPPKLLRIELASSGPKGTDLTVLVNGYELFNEHIPAGKWSKTFSLVQVPLKNRAAIELLSGTFVPMEIAKGSRDRRTLGVAVTAITLLESEEALSRVP